MKVLSTTLRNVKGDIQSIKNEFNKGSYKSLLIHIYSGVVDAEVLAWQASKILDELPEAKVVGTLSAGEVKNGRVIDTDILASAMLFESTDIEVRRYDNIGGDEYNVGVKIGEDMNNIPDLKAVELFLPGTSFSTWDIFKGLGCLKEDIQVFGGYSGGHSLDIEEHFVFDAGGYYDNSILVISYAGVDFHISIDKSVGWQKIGKPFRATKAEGNRLIEIDNEPAVAVYEKFLSIPRDSLTFAEDTFEFPLIALVNNDELLRHTTSVDEDGALILAGYVTEGMDVNLCFGNPSDIVKTVNKRLADLKEFTPEAILLYSCMVRKVFWEDFIDMEMLPFQKLAPTIGFHTWGEVKRNDKTHDILEYNITLLSVGMREGDVKEPIDKEVVIDDAVLKGQASLVKRLSQLVTSSTKELQALYDNIRKLNEKLTIANEHDALTGIYNRRKIERVIVEALEDRSSVTSLIMLDIDHFKRVNDTYGHAIGDEVLRGVGRLMKDYTDRVKGSAVGRWGGEEFFIMLPNTNKEEVKAFAEGFRFVIADHVFPEVNHITISMGTITSDSGFSTSEMFIKVDDALYQAKSSGRNKVIQADI